VAIKPFGSPVLNEKETACADNETTQPVRTPAAHVEAFIPMHLLFADGFMMITRLVGVSDLLGAAEAEACEPS
jgi:hypothetical protein